MTRMTFTSLWARRRRLAGIAVAVALGVSFLSGTLTLGDTLSASFDRLFAEASAGTDVVVRSSVTVDADRGPDDLRSMIDESLVETVLAVDGVADAEGQVTGYGQIIGRDGDAVGDNGPPRIAGSWVENPALNPYRISEGRAPEAPDEVVVSRLTADAGDLQVGDVTVVQTPAPVDVTVVGIATFGDADGLGRATFTAFTLEAAQEHITGQPGQLSAIVAQADPGVGSDELRDRAQAALPGGIEVVTGSDLAGERSDQIANTFLTMLRMFLVVFAGIALVVATLSINNSFSVTVAQRTRELALLRAVGASRRQVWTLVTLEALLLGVVAAAAGAVAGVGVAWLLETGFTAAGFTFPTSGLEIRAVSLGLAMVAGVVATLIAAQGAARRAATVAPIEALREAGLETVGANRRRLAGGAAVGAVGLGLAVVAAATGSLAVAGLGALAAVSATLMTAPAVLPPVAGVMGRLLRRLRGVTGHLAAENTQRNPRRSAATATALVVGVAVVTLFTVAAASIKVTMEDQVSADFGADLAVATPSFGGGLLDPALAGELEALPEVSQAVALGDDRVRLEGDSTTVTAAGARELAEVARLDVLDGGFGSGDPNGLLVSRSRSGSEGWAVGTTVEMMFTDGAAEPMTVTGIYEDNAIVGDLVIPPDLSSSHTAQPMSRMVLVTAADRIGPESLHQAVTPLAGAYGGDVQDRDDFASASAQGLDLLLGVVYALLALAIVIALLGIGNTLSLAVYERRRELGLLRAVGQTRRQVRSVLRLESVIIASFGTLTGLVLGGFLAWVFVTTLTADEGGSFAVPGGRLAVIAVLGALAGVLAALRPARRAARLPVLEAIAAG